MTRTPVNLAAKLALVPEAWSPRVVANVNDHLVKVARLEGDFVWHRHAEADELFLVLEGELRIELRDGEVILGPGELYVVPRGVEHRPRAGRECRVVIVEPAGVVNTGDVGGALTAPVDEWL